MVSKLKALISLAVSGGVVAYCHTSVASLSDLVPLCPILMVYCLADIKHSLNNFDMVLHHLSTIMLNISCFSVHQNLHRLSSTEQQDVFDITSSFFLVEMSTIWLALMHLGFRNWVVRLLFLSTFIYYRIGYLTYLLWTRYQTRFITVLCQDSCLCRANWYLGSTTLITLNYYWLCVIVLKIWKKTRPRIKLQ